MKLRIPNLPTLLNLISALILLVGLASAAWIYQSAGKAPLGASGYENEGRIIYMPDHTKKYRHDLELYGGKANVMMDDFVRWFGGLWQGKSLAKSIAVLSAIISFGFFYVANHLIPRLKAEVRQENLRDGTEID